MAIMKKLNADEDDESDWKGDIKKFNWYKMKNNIKMKINWKQ